MARQAACRAHLKNQPCHSQTTTDNNLRHTDNTHAPRRASERTADLRLTWARRERSSQQRKRRFNCLAEAPNCNRTMETSQGAWKPDENVDLRPSSTRCFRPHYFFLARSRASHVSQLRRCGPCVQPIVVCQGLCSHLATSAKHSK